MENLALVIVPETDENGDFSGRKITLENDMNDLISE